MRRRGVPDIIVELGTPLFKVRIDAVNELIRRGQFSQAQSSLQLLSSNPQAKKHRLALAALCRRADIPMQGIRLLHAAVRRSRPFVPEANEREMAEFAACLAQAGIPQEAEGLLAQLDAEKNAEVFLFRAFSAIAQWDYARAIPLLRSYIDSPQVKNYRRLVGLLNLAGAYVTERNGAAASPLLTALLHDTSGLPFLHGVALQYSAENAIYERRWEEAENFLHDALKQLTDDTSLETLFAKKWLALLHLLKSRGAKDAVAGVEKIKTLARRFKHWETIRQCDRYLGEVLHDDALIHRVYFGTPHMAFRESLRTQLGPGWTLPSSYCWTFGKATTRMPKLNLAEGTFSDGSVGFRAGEVAHRMLAALASDFYRPIRIPSLFSHVYPGEYFNPENSPTRLHQAVTMLRAWAKAAKFPLRVVSSEQGLVLDATAPCGVVLTVEKKVSQRVDLTTDLLFDHFQHREFSAADAATLLGVSPRSVNRTFKRMAAEGRVIASGAGPSTRYSLKNQTSSQRQPNLEEKREPEQYARSPSKK